MKFLIVAVFVVFAVSVHAIPPPKEVLAEVMGKCAETSGAAPEIIEKIRNHDLSFDDSKGKCFEKCMCKSLGLCDEDFKLAKEPFSAHPKVPSDKVRLIERRTKIKVLRTLLNFLL